MDLMSIGVSILITVFAPYLASASLAPKINLIGGVLKVAKLLIDKGVEISSVIENSKGGVTLEQEINVVVENEKKELIDKIAVKANKKLKIFKTEDIKKFLTHTADIVEDGKIEQSLKDFVKSI